jgi:hypothetical protein
MKKGTGKLFLRIVCRHIELVLLLDMTQQESSGVGLATLQTL